MASNSPAENPIVIDCECRFEAEPILLVLQEVEEISGDHLKFPSVLKFKMCIHPSSGAQFIQFRNAAKWIFHEVNRRSMPVDWNTVTQQLRNGNIYGVIDRISRTDINITLNTYKQIEIQFRKPEQLPTSSTRRPSYLYSALRSIERYLDTTTQQHTKEHTPRI